MRYIGQKRSASSSRASGGERKWERRRNADLFKSLDVELTRVEPRKHTRFSLFSRDRAASRDEAGRRDADRSTILPLEVSGGAGGDERRRDVDGYVQKITFATNRGRPGGPWIPPLDQRTIPGLLHSIPVATHDSWWGYPMLSVFLARGGAATERARSRRSSLKWCECCRVSRRLECPVRAGDGPNERTRTCTLYILSAPADASLVWNECPSIRMSVPYLSRCRRLEIASQCCVPCQLFSWRATSGTASRSVSSRQEEALTRVVADLTPRLANVKQELGIEVRDDVSLMNRVIAGEKRASWGRSRPTRTLAQPDARSSRCRRAPSRFSV